MGVVVVGAARMPPEAWRRLGLGLLLALLLAAGAIFLPRWIGFPRDGFVPSSVVTHSAMWIGALILGRLLVPGGLKGCGLIRGTYRFRPRILIWALPTMSLSILGGLAAGPEATPTREILQSILFIWIYASASEEIFTRGFLQGFLEPLRGHRIRFLWRWPVSIPVLVSALFFGGMHVVLWPAMGPAALVPMTLATGLGFLAGVLRERTESLAPAFLVHLLFNLGGMTPMWLIGAIRS